MTEEEWKSCASPDVMLEFICASVTPSERKLRLVACAYCRRIWHLLVDKRSRDAVLFTEDYGDGHTRPVGKGQTCYAANRAARELKEQEWLVNEVSQKLIEMAAAAAAAELLNEGASWPGRTPVQLAAGSVAHGAANAVEYEAKMQGKMGQPAKEAERAAQCDLLRDIFGNPFRPKSLDSSLLAWNFNTIPLLARAAYEERRLPEGTLDPFRLAVLGDALEEAGRGNAELLNHLRQPAIHVRGCWALDLLLGKE